LLYLPEEDSLLLKEALDLNKNSIKNKIVLDLGCGSCFLTEELRKLAKTVISSDLDFNVLIKNANLNKNNVFLVNANLLYPFKRIFDFIFFNPPYLNFDEREGYYLDTTGGIKGYELSLKFVDQLINSLKIGGKAYLIASNYSLTPIINKIKQEKIFDVKILKEKNLIFEKIYLLEIKYSNLLSQFKNFFNSRPCYKLKFFNKGKNSVILKDKNGWLLKINDVNKNYREFFYLNLIKKKIRFYNLFIPEFYLKEGILFIKKIEGINLEEINKLISTYKNEKRKSSLLCLKYKILLKSLWISFILDKLGINKEEMNHPEKHIIFSKGKVFFIDFEKAHLSKKRKNVTQLTFYITKELKKDFQMDNKLKIYSILKNYKNSYSLKEFKKLIEFFKLILKEKGCL
jgi:putative serine/threonine protein kinase